MFKRWPHGDLKKILKGLYGGGVESIAEALAIAQLKVRIEKSNKEGAKDVAKEEKQVRGGEDKRNGEQVRSSRLPYVDRETDPWND